ncbi:hypothetical protein K0M31_018521, partial [Melipona bicolor]
MPIGANEIAGRLLLLQGSRRNNFSWPAGQVLRDHAIPAKYDYFGGGKKYGEVERLPCMKHAKVNVDVICHDEKALYPMSDTVSRIRQSAPMEIDVQVSGDKSRNSKFPPFLPNAPAAR